ncbi:hypothetical protein RI129_011966 [Pyrocoelia pectoralis]|uniref:R3H domain-containing protein n=1 Tax=Pyrocoelia pectoralis TaxID=417401 RepID=A0AAN7V3S4_9COLE
MTVTKGRRPTYVYPNSHQASGTESLHLATPTTTDVDSESESIPHLPATGRCTIFEPFWCNRKNLGRRKQRILFNHLRIVNEEVDNSDYIQLMETYKTPFARVLEDKNALSQWNEFIELPEEQQQQLTEPVPKIQQHTQSEDKSDNLRPKLSSRIKRAIKVKKNLSMEMVQTLENDVINYFISSPEGIFTSSPSTSFERLLLHAIANYHHLKSISVINIGIRTVQVTCIHMLWKPMDVSFCNFAKQLSQ